MRTKRALQRSRIIQRPRLLSLLDGAGSRVRMLVAAAGYGKTTLAEQWVTQPGRRYGWYTARTASADVAALALGLARSASAVVEGSEVRLREHLRAVSAAGEHTTVLAEILSEDLQSWPSDAWLVIDDYQEFLGASEAEGLVAELAETCPVQLLIGSRQRPTWVSTRSVIYGDVFEVNQAALAMDNEEAAEVLVDWSAPSASGLVALANGWPAVIGLAGVSSAEIDTEDPVPESLYRFFAEEVFEALGAEVREGLALLAIAPVVDRELAETLLGDRAEAICAAAIEVGILVTRDDRLELHPLARAFLEERTATANPDRDSVALCLRHYESRRDWDAAFELVTRHGPDHELPRVVESALDDLLETARLSTIDSWCLAAAKRGLTDGILWIARAEVMLRQAQYAQAQAFAEVAAATPDLSFRSFALAGRAAHLASSEEEGLDLYKRAEAAATTAAQRYEALWGQLLCAIELNLPEANGMLANAIAGVDRSNPTAYVRATTCKLMFDVRAGTIDLRDGDVAWELIPVIEDPLIETAFENVYANALVLAARYKDAIRVTNTLLATAETQRIDFARPYGLVIAGAAHAGMRGWPIAHEFLDQASMLARATHNRYVELFGLAARLRVLAQQGLHTRALALPVPSLEGAIPAIRSEVLASRALALVAAGRLDEAEDTLAQLESDTSIEPMVLGSALELAIALKRGARLRPGTVGALEELTFRTGALDLLVATYRAIPELLIVLFRPGPSARLIELVRAVGDDDLLRPLNAGAPEGDRTRTLTRREREVYELLCRSFTNRQIADTLVISESTAKLHVHRVLKKLGVHSRQALAVQAALEGPRQATSATGDCSVNE